MSAPILQMVEGDTFKVSCLAEGNPPPVIFWMKETAKDPINHPPSAASGLTSNEAYNMEYVGDVLKQMGAGMYLKFDQLHE